MGIQTQADQILNTNNPETRQIMCFGCYQAITGGQCTYHNHLPFHDHNCVMIYVLDLFSIRQNTDDSLPRKTL